MQLNNFSSLLYIAEEEPNINDHVDIGLLLDCLWSLRVYLMSKIEMQPSRYMTEKTMQMDVLGKTLYGTMDLYHIEEDHMYDYKVTTAFNIMRDPQQKKWIEQTNIYAHMLRNGLDFNSKTNLSFNPKAISILCILKDWDSFKAKKILEYPKSQIHRIDIPVVSNDYVQKHIEKLMSDHIYAEQHNAPRQCTAEERWYKQDKYGIFDANGVKIKEYTELRDAENYVRINNLLGMVKIYTTQGDSTRCDKFCPVNKHCIQYKNSKL